jgi:energy-coupling factor transport system permease protein
LISIYSAVFVKTTDPTEFVMSLIKYFKMPVKIGYAFLTAYRFLPSFKDELETIKYAHQVRGIVESRNPVVQVWNSQKYIIPMMANAVRKGIRISMAMETRAFGKYETRTFYRKLEMNTEEIAAAAAYIIYILVILTLLTAWGFTRFGFKVN